MIYTTKTLLFQEVEITTFTPHLKIGPQNCIQVGKESVYHWADYEPHCTNVQENYKEAGVTKFNLVWMKTHLQMWKISD